MLYCLLHIPYCYRWMFLNNAMWTFKKILFNQLEIVIIFIFKKNWFILINSFQYSSFLVNLSRGFKKFKKIRLGSKLLLSLIYGSGFRIWVASIFQQNLVHKTGLMLYLADFHSWNWWFRVLMRIRPNIEPYSSLKPTKVGFIFIGLNSLSRA